MLKSGIKKKYQIKLAEFNKHNKLYYNKSKPIISDSEFDDLKKEIIELEKKHKFLKNKKSPSTTIGYKPAKNFVKSNISFC